MTTYSSEFTQPLPDGRRCVVRLAVPQGLMPSDGWPIAYVLDVSQFETLRRTAGADGLPGILVGLAPQVPAQRVWDYPPRGWATGFAAGDPAARPQAGPAGFQGPGPLPADVLTGAARWLHALDGVRSRVTAEFRPDPSRQVLAGHSLGALFAFYVLLHRPRAFDGYVLSSPSVWWGGGYARRLARRRLAWLAAQGLPGLGLFLTVGEYEQSLSPGEMSLDAEEREQQLLKRRRRAMVDGVRALAEDLGACPGLRLRHVVLPGHIHRTAPQDALMSGWRWLLAQGNA
ncbi:alpha/beta hydrolase [uncultured Castellaniella sp.]|uniref:alpha/beta hydrolase n=1 Tax=uncultured Castellaniella sp. TaxID=647907 RepID=UPI002630955C|nr:alpha/beta hydrolase [uncultured Castellaniella sp.]